MAQESSSGQNLCEEHFIILSPESKDLFMLASISMAEKSFNQTDPPPFLFALDGNPENDLKTNNDSQQLRISVIYRRLDDDADRLAFVETIFLSEFLNLFYCFAWERLFDP